MDATKRDVLKLLAATALVSGARIARAADASALYDVGKFGDARLIHITDTHAQLEPVYFREPSINIGVGAMTGRPPHLVGEAFLDRFGIAAGTDLAYAFTCLDFNAAAHHYGRLGGFAHIKTLIDQLRAEVGPGRSLLLDGGDLWQGSGLANLDHASDMVDASNLLGIEVLTGHWEFTYGEQVLRDNLKRFKGQFLAQNVYLTDEARFNDAPAFDTDSGRAFQPSMVHDLAGHRIGIVGQAFPYVPVAHPKRFVPDWTFGIRETELQQLVDQLREAEKVDAVVLLSHNGMDVDLKLASRVRGIDVVLGGHTHDATPQPIVVDNPGGKTLVVNGGSAGKFVGVLDLQLGKGRIMDLRYRLLPVFANVLKPDADMEALIAKMRAPHAGLLDRPVATAGQLLFRRGNFNGTVDQAICDALRQQLDAEIALSPGFRWGNTMLPGDAIAMRDVFSETAITYPEVYVQEMTGQQIKDVMEDVCDNLFNPDPYYQQGGDMVRIGGMDYACSPSESTGRRISDLRLDNGKDIDPSKTYKVAGWASVNPQQGRPVWEILEKHFLEQKVVKLERLNRVDVKGVSGNPGLLAD